MRHYIDTPTGPVEIEPFTFAHEGGGPHRSCDACLAVESDGRLIHAAGCGAAKVQPRRDLYAIARELTDALLIDAAQPDADGMIEWYAAPHAEED